MTANKNKPKAFVKKGIFTARRHRSKRNIKAKRPPTDKDGVDELNNQK